LHLVFFERTGTGSAYFIDIEEVYSRDPAQKLQVCKSIYKVAKSNARSFAPAAIHVDASPLIFASKDGGAAALRLKTLSFLSFQTSQITRRISERTPLRGTSGRCERFFHHRLGDLLAGQTAGLSSVRPAHSATKTQVLCV
jgi:hypothetical protein